MVKATPEQTVVKQNGTGNRSIVIVILLALFGWLSYRYLNKPNKKNIKDEKQTKTATDDPLSSTLSRKDAQTVEAAAAKYDKDYQARMRQMEAPKDGEKVAPFIGFSLADNITEGSLVVDGVFEEGPAFQVGVDINHELLGIEHEYTSSIQGVRQLIQKHCHPGKVSLFHMKDPDGKPYDAQLWVMTSDSNYASTPYYFNPAAHQARQSDRLKQTWKPEEIAKEMKK